MPFPRQADFLACAETEAFYGGAAGGGKSDALLMGALEHVDVPGYSALILRKTFRALNMANAIMDRSHQWLRKTDAVWRAMDKQWVFPSGATITFGYLAHRNDLDQYDSAEFQHIAFDELTEFEEFNYRYLFSRLRKPLTLKVPLRMRSAGMPGGIGHDWVKSRFIDGTHRFVPARAADNFALDQDAYRDSLSHLDEATRRQREDGIWEQDAAGLMYQQPTALLYELPPGAWSYIRALDFGIKDRNAIAVLGWRKHDPATYILSARYFRGGPAALGVELAKDTRDFVRTIGDLGGMGKAFQEDIQLHNKIPIEGAEKPPNQKLGHIRLINDELSRGTLKVLASGCADLLKEYATLLRRENGTEHPGQDNHCADAVLYGWRASPSYMERERVEPPTVGTAEWEAAEAKRIEREMVAEERRGRRRGWLRQMT